MSVVGGVVTAIFLERLRGSSPEAPAPDPHQSRQAQKAQRAARTGGGIAGFFGQLIRIVLSVAGGVFRATAGARIIFQSGLLDRNPINRIGILVAGTVVCWLILLMLFRRR